jgi:hypothetical protein
MYCLKLKRKSKGLKIIGNKYIESITTPLNVNILSSPFLYIPVSNKNTAIPNIDVIVSIDRINAIILKYVIALSIGTAIDTKHVIIKNTT